MRTISLLMLIVTAGMAQVPPARTHVLFNLARPEGGPFPSNRFTVLDPSQLTRRRVNLPMPDCGVRRSDCADLQVVNELDGFSVQPRLSIPFDGPIDPGSVTSRTIFILRLESTAHPEGPIGTVVGLNQLVWDPSTNTLYAESDEQLDQHTVYALIVTSGVLDPRGNPVLASQEFRNFRRNRHFSEDIQPKQPHDGQYENSVDEGIQAAVRAGVRDGEVVAASVFTTQSVTAVLEKVRAQLDSTTAAPANFLIGRQGQRTVFRLDQIKGITWNRQTGDNPPVFTASAVAVSLLNAYAPGAVAGIAFGKYTSPDYMNHPGEYIPPIETLTGIPQVQGLNQVYFNLFLPSTPRPPAGWPVVIWGHGGSGSKDDNVYNIAASLASQGLATIAISAVGRGGGPQGTLQVNLMTGESVILPSG
ncbi:MAG TPA: Ig-like domain-containing protein, partial [Candidatus Solibacter sp.]|nr:Ig-like domain-containing protein [Candidatus Solibacter sp.]